MKIERNFNKFLYSLVLKSLPNNKVAKTVVLNYSRLDKSSKENFFESLVPFYNSFTDRSLENIKFEQTSKIELPDNAPKDYRIKAVRLANVRGIPEAKSKIKFGFDLDHKNSINNFVLLGPNGTGKSSIFGSLEYIYTKTVSEKKLRTRNANLITENNFLDFLAHFNSAPECEIETPAGKFSLRNNVFKTDEDIEILHPGSHFIGDYDIYNKGQLEYSEERTSNSFHLLIASSLGLQEYLDFNGLLKSLSGYRRLKESNRRRSLQNEIENLQNEISKNDSEVNIKNSRVSELKTTSTDRQIYTDEKISTLLSSLKQTKFQISFNKTEYLKSIENYKIEHERFLGLSVNLGPQKEAQFLSLGLDLLKYSENCPFCQNSTLSINELKLLIENRISQIKEFETASKSLESSIERVSYEVRELNNSLHYISRLLKIEKDNLIAISELEPLRQNEIELDEIIDGAIGHLDNFDKMLNGLLLDSSSLIKKDQMLFDWNHKNQSNTSTIPFCAKCIDKRISSFFLMV